MPLTLNTHKAGLSEVDLTRTDAVLNSTRARASKYYQHQEALNQKAQRRIQLWLEKVRHARSQPALLARWGQEVRQVYAGLRRPPLHEAYLHMDMDAFFASVEMRDCPALGDVPLGVGSDYMLSTSNYHARRYGVRAGMPGFLARELCPSLVIVPCQFAKYEAIGDSIRQSVLRGYDPEFRSLSCDEATLHLTSYCEAHGVSPAEVAEGVRTEVYRLTSLTCSVGVAPTPSLSKLAAQEEKPNGCSVLSFTTQEAFDDYVREIPVRKVPFLGKRAEEQLHALHIYTLGDINTNSAVLWGTLPRKTALFFLSCARGWGGSFPDSLCEIGEPLSRPSRVLRVSKHTEDTEHSISKERTFPPPLTREALLSQFERVFTKVWEYYLGEYVESSLLSCVTVKLKFTSFETKQRCFRLSTPVNDRKVIHQCAYRLLGTEGFPLDLRLLGIKLTLHPIRQSLQSILPQAFSVKDEEIDFTTEVAQSSDISRATFITSSNPEELKQSSLTQFSVLRKPNEEIINHSKRFKSSEEVKNSTSHEGILLFSLESDSEVEFVGVNASRKESCNKSKPLFQKVITKIQLATRILYRPKKAQKKLEKSVKKGRIERKPTKRKSLFCHLLKISEEFLFHFSRESASLGCHETSRVATFSSKSFIHPPPRLCSKRNQQFRLQIK